MPPVLTTRIPACVAATIVAATVVPPNPGLTIAAARFQGETLTASARPARAAHSSTVRPTRNWLSKTATTAGVTSAFSQASHCCRTASIAAPFGRPWVITADSRATTAPPDAIASRTVAAIARLVTLGMLRGYIQQDAAGVAELVQAHGLGPCGASHGGSSPFARTIQHHRAQGIGQSGDFPRHAQIASEVQIPAAREGPIRHGCRDPAVKQCKRPVSDGPGPPAARGSGYFVRRRVLPRPGEGHVFDLAEGPGGRQPGDVPDPAHRPHVQAVESPQRRPVS